MANNYTLFSTALGKCTNEECEWLKAEYARTHDETLVDPSSGDEVDNPDYDQEAGTFDFDMDAGDVSIYSEECGDCEAAANLIQAFLKKFRPKQYTTLEAAFTCSKARPGEFGGSVCVITAKKQHWMNTSTWADLQAKKLKLNSKQRIF